MKKCVNGKLIEMTEEDINKQKSRFANRLNARKTTADYEARVKYLENTVSELMSKLSEKEQ